jgi:hypothetical protein
MKRYVFLTTFLLQLAVISNQAAYAADNATSPPKKVQLLFVQNASSVELTKNKLTLNSVSPTTIFFSDRPDRITGHVRTAHFISQWSKGSDNFTADPPNATLSVFSKKKARDVVVELRNPLLKGNALTYDVKILHGKVLAKAGPCSLFIDAVGRPLTPRSFAGADRRLYRRGDTGGTTVVYDDGDSDADDDDSDNN